MNGKILKFEDCIPVVGVMDDVIIARDGAVTIGWEIFPPEEYTATSETYDAVTSLMSSAFRSLPEWTMVHRQDVYSRKFYRAEATGHFLEDCYEEHFDRRPFLGHRQFIWLSFNPARSGRAGAMKGTLQGAALGIRYRSPQVKGLPEKLQHFESRCSEFVSTFASAGGFTCRRLKDADLEGTAVLCGILEDYRNWFAGEHDGSDIIQQDGTYLDRDSRRMLSYSFSRVDDLPGEVSNMMKVRSLSTEDCDILLSSAAPIGGDLPYEHIVNFYYLFPNQAEALRDLDRRRKNMMSMSKNNAENSVNADGIAQFINLIHAESTMAVYSHMNVLLWGEREQELAMRGAAGSALSQMGLIGKLNTRDIPQLWIAGLPGSEMEIGEDNMMISELEQALCLGINESFMRDFPGGLLKITDRHRHTPIVIDTQQRAYDAKLIENYNAFILGPSGSGKSFFTNWYVSRCYYDGQHVFIIDKGDSYEGLCAIIREESGGADGTYYRWDRNHPYSFAPFAGCRTWKDDAEGYGLSYLMSLLKIIWTPKGGWTSAQDAILAEMIAQFIGSLEPDGVDPVFSEFHAYLGGVIQPLILSKDDSDGLYVGGARVDADAFNIKEMLQALAPYAEGGRFSFLLNDRKPAEIFSSRFIVFEVDAIEDIDKTLYKLCTFCIINAFQRRMRSDSDTFRLLFIEEAWQAIANENTAEYLRALWKTARKYHTSATVVTQQISDIISSNVIKDAILNNSPVKILLDQQSNAASFGQISQLLGLSPIDRALVRSVGRNIPMGAPYKEVFITLGGKRSGVFALEVSPQEALVFESDKIRKRPLLELAERTGSIREAVRQLTQGRAAV